MTSVALGATVQLPQTGQSTCYDSSGAVIPCVGTGQDGDLQKGVAWPSPRFFDNLDGTVTDHLTGLMWMKDANCFLGQSWLGALNRIKDLDDGTSTYTCQDYTATYTDWRTPNILELETLAHSGYNEESCAGSPCGSLGAWLESVGFINTAPGNTNYYWSSTTSKNDSLNAWRLLMADGRISSYAKTSTYWILPVRTAAVTPTVDVRRTGQVTSHAAGDDGDLRAGVPWPDPRFTDHGDGTVTDELSGLMWLEDANCMATNYPAFDTDAVSGDGKVTWQHALDFVQEVNSGTYSVCGMGYKDWRLANRKELGSLVDFSTHYGSALPPGSPFLNVQWNEYWSSTSYGGSATLGNEAVWLVYFLDGAVFRNTKNSFGFVWLVRSPGPDGDPDGDGIRNVDDNCPNTANPDQNNIDGDGLGDACDPDMDNDGMPNDWEDANGTDKTVVDGHLDPDGDGSVNVVEFMYGTNPQLSSSVPTTTIITLPPGLNVISIPFVPGGPGYTAHSLLTLLGSADAVSIQRYDETTGAFVTTAWVQNPDTSWSITGPDFPLERGKGYLLYMLNGTTFTP